MEETTEYQDAVNYRENIESGEINKGGFIPGSKYLKLLEYMEREIDGREIQISDMAGYIAGMTCFMCNYLERSMCYDQKTNLLQKLARIQDVVNKQAEDEGLWFDARTAPEAYLQKALRGLHRMIEDG